MNENIHILLAWYSATLEAMTRGQALPETPLQATEAIGSDELAAFNERILRFVDHWSEFRAFAETMAGGDLSASCPRGNQLVAPLKSLQASLRHLTWQTERVAAGDLNQQVEFMGDYSLAFNSMIVSLRQACNFPFSPATVAFF